jgi:hypothetical protein
MVEIVSFFLSLYFRLSVSIFELETTRRILIKFEIIEPYRMLYRDFHKMDFVEIYFIRES